MAADIKANACDKCSLIAQVFCACGCEEVINRSIAQLREGTIYKHGHGLRGKTYFEIYGTSIPNCGYRIGEENVAKRPESRKKISEKLKAGAHWIYRHPEVGVRIKSKLEDLVALYLRGWERHKRVGRYTVDFIDRKNKKILEVFGCYWHACPACAEVIVIPEGSRIDVNKYDKQRIEFLESEGWQVEVLWEHEVPKWIEKMIYNKEMVTVSRYHDISCGHRVVGHEGHCSNLHGHNYRITFTCASTQLDSIGRVIDFAQIKTLLCDWLEDNWDHRFLVWKKDPLKDKLKAIDKSVVFVSFNPTAEMLAYFLVHNVGPKQFKDTGIRLIKCSVEETRKCSASYGSDEIDAVTYSLPEYESLQKQGVVDNAVKLRKVVK